MEKDNKLVFFGTFDKEESSSYDLRSAMENVLKYITKDEVSLEDFLEVIKSGALIAMGDKFLVSIDDDEKMFNKNLRETNKHWELHQGDFRITLKIDISKENNVYYLAGKILTHMTKDHDEIRVIVRNGDVFVRNFKMTFHQPKTTND